MSKRTVAVVDYGMGNLRSVAQAVAHVAREVTTPGDEIEVVVTADPDVVAAAERVGRANILSLVAPESVARE